MSNKQINQLPSGIANSNSFVAADNADLTITEKIKLGDIAKLPHDHNDMYYTETEINTLLAGKQDFGNYAILVDGLVPSSQLPSYVDDVVEAANLAAFPAVGEASKIYVAINNNKTYRWSGSTYVDIVASPGSTDAVPEGSLNKYYTDARASAAAPVQSVNGQVGVVSIGKSDIGLGNVNNTSDINKPVSTAVQEALNLKVNVSDLQTSIESAINTSLVAGLNIELDYNAENNALSISTTNSPSFDSVQFSGSSMNTGNMTINAEGITFADGTTQSTASTKVVESTYSSTTNTDASSGDIFDLTLTGNTTLANPTNPVNGKTIRWRITQDGTGNRNVTLGNKFNLPSSSASPLPWSAAPNKMDILAATYHAGRDKWDVIAFVPGY